MSMQITLTSLWHPVKGVCIKDLGSQRFMFQFFNEMDIQRVERRGPWTFDLHVLITKRLNVNEQPLMVPLFQLSIWLQVHDLPVGIRFEKRCKLIGAYM
ncbi:hypothetical protein PTKIN_Ptkin09bG0222300 [Pterospermum kingtungense]